MLSELPSDPGLSQTSENIVLQTTDTNFNNNFDNRKNENAVIEQDTMNMIVNGIQKASILGATKLPARDIPTNTGHLTQDVETTANYVPQPSHNVDFVKNHETEQEMYLSNTRELNKKNSLDVIYEELQVPILIAFLFFLFQLPFFNKIIFQYAPFLFVKDGNLKLSGYITTSLIFSTLYYTLSKILKHFSNI